MLASVGEETDYPPSLPSGSELTQQTKKLYILPLVTAIEKLFSVFYILKDGDQYQNHQWVPELKTGLTCSN